MTGKAPITLMSKADSALSAAVGVGEATLISCRAVRSAVFRSGVVLALPSAASITRV